MVKFVYHNGQMVEKDTGLPMLNQEERARPLQVPYAFGDVDGYHSPIDGKWIEGRRARRYDLESNGCVDANDLRTEKRLKNKRFIKKRGLQELAE